MRADVVERSESNLGILSHFTPSFHERNRMPSRGARRKQLSAGCLALLAESYTPTNLCKGAEGGFIDPHNINIRCTSGAGADHLSTDPISARLRCGAAFGQRHGGLLMEEKRRFSKNIVTN